MNSDRLAQSSYCAVRCTTHTHTHTHKWPNIMQKLVNDSQTISKILWNLMFHCCSVYNSPPVHILSHINSFQELPTYFFMIHFSVILPLPLGLPTGLFHLRWTYNIAVCIFPCATWLANHIFYLYPQPSTTCWEVQNMKRFVMLFSITSYRVLPLFLSNFAPSHITIIHSWFGEWN